MTREIQLSQGFVALVDDEDYERVMAAGKWTADRHPNVDYARRNVRLPNGCYRTIRLHTFVTGWSYVDHINGDGLDNRRSNLRLSDKPTNMRNRGTQKNNTSGFKGVSWSKDKRKWQAAITVNGRSINLGRHPAPEDAARAYDDAAREYFGDFARLNFPEGADR